jgi:formate hydrogenlyase subunit 3/multisubunit Na+/H+ antiporter MnhD subunit
VGKLVYKPVAVLLGATAGAVAGFVFTRLWRVLSTEDSAPEPTDEERAWGEVLAAAALQGLIYAVVRAVVERAGATGVRRLTGHRPKL